MMFTPCGPRAVPTGGAGVAGPACRCTFTSAAIFFLGGISGHVPSCCTSWSCRARSFRALPPQVLRVLLVPSSAQTFWIWLKLSSTGVSRPKISTRALTLCDSALISVIVACRVANGPSTTMTESDTSKSATSTFFLVAVPVPARSGVAACAPAGPLGSRGCGLGGHRGREHALDLVEAQRDRLVAVPDEAGHRGRVTYGGPGLVCEVHPDQHVAGEHGALDQLALAVLDLRDLLGRDDHLVDVVLHVQGGDPVLEVGLHPVLHAGVGVHHEPVPDLGPERLAELLEWVAGGVRVDRRTVVRGRHGLGVGRRLLRHSGGVVLVYVDLGNVGGNIGGLGVGRGRGLELFVVRLRHGYSVTFIWFAWFSAAAPGGAGWGQSASRRP